MNRSSLHCVFAAAAVALLSSAVLAKGQTPFAAPTASSIGNGSLQAQPVLIAAASPAIDEVLPAGVSSSASQQGLIASVKTADWSQALPDAPSVAMTEIRQPEAEGAPQTAAPLVNTASPNVAPKLTKYIPSGWSAQALTGHDKVLLGLRDLYSPLNFVAMFASAGYEHVLNGEPNYGTDRGAFGERLGAAAIRESTQGLFTDSVFSPLLHEDPRYYVRGSKHNFIARTLYAGTRVLVTRTDNGNTSVNGALLAGYAASAALSYSYYPQINKNFHDTAATFGTSLGGAALGFVVSEFSDDLLKAVHLKK